MSTHDLLDIYTLEPMLAPSNEHIIHDFLGGSLQGRLLDRSTNSRLGHTIDKALHRNVQDLLLRLDLRSGSGNEPPPSRKNAATDQEWRRWRLLPQGKFQCDTVSFRLFDIVVAEDGQIQLNLAVDGGEHLTPEVCADMLFTRLLRDPRIPDAWKQRTSEEMDESRRNLEAMLRAGLTQSTVDITWASSFEITHETLRAVVKIACNFFALHNRAAFCEVGFNPARRYVHDGEGNPPIQLFYPPPREVGAMRHGVAFDVGEDGAVSGVVTLFGHLCFRLNLGLVAGSPLTARRQFYVVDQPGRQSNSGAPAEFPPFDHSLSLKESIDRFLPFQRGNLIQIVEVADMVRQLASLPPDATEDDRQRVFTISFRRIVESLARNGVIQFR